MFSDAFAQVGLLDYSNADQRQRWIRGFAWFFPLSWTVLGLTFKAPVAMVTAGGLANAGLLLLVVYAALPAAKKRTSTFTPVKTKLMRGGDKITKKVEAELVEQPTGYMKRAVPRTPLLLRSSTTSCTGEAPEPIMITTRSASGSPT